MENIKIEDYLRKHSLKYRDVVAVKELARGGESVVYRLDHKNLDEVVLKQTLLTD